MNVYVASLNPVKISAVREVLREYFNSEEYEVEGITVPSGVREQPLSLDETTQGAITRAKGAFRENSYSFGIESGLMKVPGSRTGYMNVCACAIYDGTREYLGLSSAFEFPKEVTRLLVSDGLTANQAAQQCNLTRHEKVGNEEGLIGILTNGRVTRRDYTKEAVRMALLQLNNKELY